MARGRKRAREAWSEGVGGRGQGGERERGREGERERRHPPCSVPAGGDSLATSEGRRGAEECAGGRRGSNIVGEQ